MTRTNSIGPRPGVTLIEILVVLAIVGILMALTAAALQKTVEGQNVKTSETQVFKLQQALDQEYERVVAQCARDATSEGIPPQIVAVCDGDKARAKAVWTAFQLRLNFPDSFAEATITPLVITDAGGAPVYSIPRPTTFAAIPTTFALSSYAANPAGPFQAEEESGALLYMILAKRSVAGGGAMATSAEDLTQASRRKVSFGNGVELETFSDAFQRSVGFRRWEQTQTTQGNFLNLPNVAVNNNSGYTSALWLNEVQKAPFVDATKANRDPLDPQGLVLNWTFTNPTDRRKIIRDGLIPDPTATPAAPRYIRTGLYFNGLNRMATVYSTGKTKTVSKTDLTLTPDNDILGFKLRKQGERGFKQ